MRPFWDEQLSLLVADNPNPSAAKIANELEAHIKAVEKQRDDFFAEIKRAQHTIDRLAAYREKLLCFISETTSEQRDRIYELANDIHCSAPFNPRSQAK